MSSQATVKVGRAHHTRRATDADAGGGGGGKGTMEGAVMTSSLLLASMTVSEVTSRIALVGGLAMLGLLLVARSSSQRQRASVVHRARVLQVSPLPLKRERNRQALHLVPLAVLVGATGVGVGVVLSLLFLLALGAAGQGAV